jgi:hypothetical protein
MFRAWNDGGGGGWSNGPTHAVSLGRKFSMETRLPLAYCGGLLAAPSELRRAVSNGSGIWPSPFCGGAWEGGGNGWAGGGPCGEGWW